MTPPSVPRALGTATRGPVAAPMLGAVALVMRPRAARGKAALYAPPNGAELRSEP